MLCTVPPQAVSLSTYMSTLTLCLCCTHTQTQTETTRTCFHGCNQSSVSFIPSPFIILQIVQGLTSLEQLLNASTEEHHDMFICEMCEPGVDDAVKQRVYAQLKTNYRRLADVTFIQLLRFKHALGPPVISFKDNTNIRIPRVLHEADVCTPDATGVFDLTCIILHQGTLHGGM